MIIAVFGSLIVGVFFLFLAQKRTKVEKWILIILATLCFVWPIISHYVLKPVNLSLPQSQNQEIQTDLQNTTNESREEITNNSAQNVTSTTQTEEKHFFFNYDCKSSDKIKTGETYKIWWSDKISPGEINNFFPDGTHIKNETYGSGYAGVDEYILKSPIFICSSYPHLNSVINEYCLFIPGQDKLGYVRIATYEERRNLGDKIPYLCIEE